MSAEMKLKLNTEDIKCVLKLKREDTRRALKVKLKLNGKDMRCVLKSMPFPPPFLPTYPHLNPKP